MDIKKILCANFGFIVVNLNSNSNVFIVSLVRKFTISNSTINQIFSIMTYYTSQ